MKNTLKKLILNNKEALAGSVEMPLLYCSKLIDEERVVAREPEVANRDFKDYELKRYTEFTNVSVKSICYIRWCIHNGLVDDNILNWCEKILRYCEVRYASLKQRARDQQRSGLEINRLFNQIVSLFIEYYLTYKDLRFINSALKLMDFKWLKQPFLSGKTLLPAKVLYTRNLVLMEGVLNQVEHE